MTRSADAMRLDQAVARLGLTASRSQAESYIRLGRVTVNGKVITKPGYFARPTDKIRLNQDEQFVSRAALKLKSVAEKLKLDFSGKVMLDVGSSTGGFTDFALSRGAKKCICVDVGTNQLHPKLRSDNRIELHEQTDIRDFVPAEPVDIIVVDVSFISLRQVLPHIAEIATPGTQIVAMVKPQFEAGDRMKHHGVIKNDKERREILREFELWTRKYFAIRAKADSAIPGAKGNRERFYLLSILSLSHSPRQVACGTDSRNFD